MAGGIDWFRWHHGTVSDQKFLLIARKADSKVAACIAVWATILEFASHAAERGNHGELDHEAIDCALGLDDGESARICGEMIARGMITETGEITAWSKRQPKRERDDASTDRVRKHREMKHQETPPETNGTPCNAMERQETPRGEERREEIKAKPPISPKGDCDESFDRFWKLYPLKKAKDQARKVWVKLKPTGDLLSQIMVALAAHRVSTDWTKDGGQFIPHASTWINQKRWEDEVRHGQQTGIDGRRPSLVEQVRQRSAEREAQRQREVTGHLEQPGFGDIEGTFSRLSAFDGEFMGADDEHVRTQMD